MELDELPKIERCVDDCALADLRREWLAEARTHVARARAACSAGAEPPRAKGVREELAKLVKQLLHDVEATANGEASSGKQGTSSWLNPLVLSHGRPSLAVRHLGSASAHLAVPEWVALGTLAGDKGKRGSGNVSNDANPNGELLFRVELVSRYESGSAAYPLLPGQSTKAQVNVSTKAPHIDVPNLDVFMKKRRRWVDVMVLGCRELKSSDFLPVQKPFLRLSIAGAALRNIADKETARTTSNSEQELRNHGVTQPPAWRAFMGWGQAVTERSTVDTKAYARPTGANPNFFERLVLEVRSFGGIKFSSGRVRIQECLHANIAKVSSLH